MVILSFDARVAHSAMVCSGWPPDVTGFAKLDGHFHCRHLAVGRRCKRANGNPLSRGWSDSQGVFVYGRGWSRVEITRDNLCILVRTYHTDGRIRSTYAGFRERGVKIRRYTDIKYIGKEDGYRW